MTEHKARKRAVRARMAKTGESYTAARSNSLKGNLIPKDVDLGKTDESVQRGSGKPWAHWFQILDSWKATEKSHTEIARFLQEKHEVPGWWAQTITVGYERGRGMRKPHQRNGGFAVSVSKTMPVDIETLYSRFSNTRARNRWLEPETLSVRTSQPPKTIRYNFKDDGSRVLVSFASKGPSKATVYIDHEKLPAPDSVEEMRAFWKERLARLLETFMT